MKKENEEWIECRRKTSDSNYNRNREDKKEKQVIVVNLSSRRGLITLIIENIRRKIDDHE